MKISAVGIVNTEEFVLSFRCSEALRETLRSSDRSSDTSLAWQFKNDFLENPVVAKGVGLLSIVADITMNEGLLRISYDSNEISR